MNKSSVLNLNDSNISSNTTSGILDNKILKQILPLGHKYLVLIDQSIIKKLGITEDSTVFVEQEVLDDNTAILMRIKKF
jgi:hypothetical protein